MTKEEDIEICDECGGSGITECLTIHKNTLHNIICYKCYSKVFIHPYKDKQND